MTPSLSLVAVDLGADSGRLMLGRLADGRVALEELHRFPTGPVRVLDSLHWDVLRFWCEIQAGLCKAAPSPRGLPTAFYSRSLLSAPKRQTAPPRSSKWIPNSCTRSNRAGTKSSFLE